MELLLLRIPLWLLAILIVGGSVLLTIAGLVRTRTTRLATFVENNEVVGKFFLVINLLYAILLGHFVVVIWQQFDRAEAVAASESASLVSLYYDARLLPESSRTVFQKALENYTRSVVVDEWPALAEGRPSAAAEAAFAAVWEIHNRFVPATPREQAVYELIVKRLSDASVDRSRRIDLSNAALRGIFWMALIVGAVLSVAYTYLFRYPNLRLHAAMTGQMAALIAMILFLAVAQDHPFAGSLAVPPDSFVSALQTFEHAGSGG